MSDLLEYQADLDHRISSIVDNLKKKGRANITPGVVRARLENLEGLWTKFESGHLTLLARRKTDPALSKDSYFLNDFFGETSETYLDQKAALLDISLSLENAHAPNGAPPRTATTDNSEPRPRHSLPKIPIPKFDGQFSEWPKFENLFESRVVKDPALTNVEKLHYLQGSITGDAELLIKNLPATDGAFDRAWTTLKDRFANKRQIVDAQFKILTSLAAVTKESAKDLKKLLYTTCSVSESLVAISRPIWGTTDLLVYLTSEKMDRESRKEWKTAINQKTEPPTFTELKIFIEGRIDTLTSLEEAPAFGKRDSVTKTEAKSARVVQTTTAQPKTPVCPLCQGNHRLFLCDKYAGKLPADRKAFIRENRLCFNCLGRHAVDQCRSNNTCSLCRRKHHTSLHEVAGKAPDATTSMTASTDYALGKVMLATAVVRSSADIGGTCEVRALVDPGSQVCLISEALAQRLHLPRRRASVPLSGIGGKLSATSKGQVEIRLSPRFQSTESARCLAFVLPALTSYTPAKDGSVPIPRTFSNLQLADPELNQHRAVDLVLGADIYPLIVRPGLLRDPEGYMVAQRSIFGWLLTGRISDPQSLGSPLASLHVSVDDRLIKSVARFWEQEQPDNPKIESFEDKHCEEHYRSTHKRDIDGRYTVRLPFRSTEPLGESKRIALRRLAGLEQRFTAQPELKKAYTAFMEEYASLGHMSISPDSEGGYFLPHHGVYRPSNTTTKLRVVFNASQPTSTGKSLNDSLYCGPNLLPDLADLLLQWRLHRVVLVADISKMYRQIRVHTDDQPYQKIVWREKENAPVRTYQLTTVTYGVICAPFLAIRTLRQLAADEHSLFPLASTVMRTDVYMDDILTGVESVEGAIELKEQLNQLCRAGGFPLHKWNSNCREVLTDTPHTADWSFVDAEEPEIALILGVRWNASSDEFLVSAVNERESISTSKRQILAEIARLFDPLGWLSPVVSWAKCFMQELWLLKVTWDAQLPPSTIQKWREFKDELPHLNSITIPRYLAYDASVKGVQVHGFADASERAIAAVIYLRSEHQNGTITIRLIGSKTKVAPLKTVSLPRLELCAAALLTRYAVRVVRVLKLTDVPLYCWTDSTVTLGWIQGRPSQWKTFVANRVSEIQTLLPQALWYHVPGKQNPADCASRGLRPAALPKHPLWWTGPAFLHAATVEFPNSADIRVEEEIRPSATLLHVCSPAEINEFLHRCSDIRRLERITAWCCRWLPAWRDSRKSPHLLGPEIKAARLRWVKRVQQQHFGAEIRLISNGRPLSASNPLSKLTPFLDDGGLLRVLGRLRHSLWSSQQKHPLIIPTQSVLANLLVADAHLRSLHGGTQATLATLRQSCWVPRGRQAVKSYIHRCHTCIRWKGQSAVQRMGDLPEFRVTPGRPFLHTGVDYAGPFSLKTMKGRGARTFKGYIALFICMVTKALHLEVVNGADSESFLAALKRFVSRRGLCEVLHSDCGTNFVGADRELREFVRLSFRPDSPTARFCASEGIEWRFNPPSAAHFGGLWEAGVKSVKHHIRRVIGAQSLTFEEFATLLASVKACLNSRPLQTLSDDPNEFAFLTPGHFLIGAPLTAYPEPSLDTCSMSRLSRWQLLSRLQQDFWRKWSREYLQTLQPRQKWNQQSVDIKKGDLCFVRNEILTPTRWPLARIVDLHPGSDGLTRVVTLRTATSLLKRPVSKLVLLPRRSSSERTDAK